MAGLCVDDTAAECTEATGLDDCIEAIDSSNSDPHWWGVGGDMEG